MSGRRYFVQRPASVPATADWYIGERYAPNLTVYEAEPAARYTGLLDVDGNKIMTKDAPRTLGFISWGINRC